MAYDATAYIDSAIKEVSGTLIITLLIVVVIIYLFMGSLRSVLVPLVAIPLYMMSAKELATSEDQGVIFGIVDAAANATLDQTSREVAAANSVFMDVPETEFTFQITSPASGFGGMVVGPWETRERTIFEMLPKVQAGLMQIPGIQILTSRSTSLKQKFKSTVTRRQIWVLIYSKWVLI